MRNGTLIRGLGLTTGLMLALAGSAQAGTGGDPPTQPYPLAHSTRVAVQGHHVAAGASSADRGSPCRMPATSLSLAPKERAVEMRQISFNPRTCRAVFERGVPPRWAKRPAAGKIQGQGRAAGPGAGSGVSTLAAGYTWGGFSSAYYKDRSTGRIYNLIEDGADWNSSRGCIGANSTWWRTAADTDTGWFRVSHSWSFVGSSP